MIRRYLLVALLVCCAALSLGARRWIPRISASAPTPDILWWPCSEGSGTTVGASVGPSSSGSNFTGSWGTIGGVNAIDLDGTNIATSDSSVTYGTQEITIKCTLNADAWGTGATVKYFADSGTVGTDTQFQLRSSFNTFYVFILKSSSYKYIAFATSNFGTGATHTATFYFNTSTSTIRAYVDGVQPTTTDSGSSGSITGANFTSKALTVGNQGGGGSNGFDGRIQQFKIYSGDKTP